MNSFLKNSILVILCLGVSLAARSQCTPTISSANPSPCNWALYATFGGSSYQWFRNGTAISGATTSTINVSQGGSYTLRANVSGCGTGTSNPIVIQNPPVASISVTAGTTNFCPGGGSATLTAQTGTGYSYQWRKDGSPNGNTTSSYIATVAGTYTCQVTNTACSLLSNAITITTPAASLAIGSSSTSASCGSPPITLYLAGPSVSGYQWYLNSTPISGANSMTYNPTQTGSYYLSAVVCGSTISSNSISITISGNPIISPQGNPNVCQPGGTISFNVTNYDPTATYQWKNSNNPSVTLGSGSTYAATQSGTYYVVETKNGFNCASNTVSANFFTINTTVTPSGSLTYCPGDNLVLTATSGYSLYFWSKDGVSIGGSPVSANTCTVTAAGTYTLSIQQQGCTQSSSPIVVTGGVIPSTPTFTQGSTTVCTGPGNIYSTQSDMSSYTWSVSTGGTIDSGQGTHSVSITWTTPGPQNVTVKYANATCTSQPASLNVNVLTTPTAQIASAGLPVFCDGGSVQLVASSQDGYSFQWYKDNAVLPGATASQYQATTAGAYKIVTSQNGCSNTSAPFAVTTTTRPAAVITPASATTICQGQSALLNASTGTNYIYQWKNENGDIAGETSSNYAATQNGTYTVVTKIGSCSAESAGQAVVVNSLPVISIVSSGATAFCENDPITLVAIGDAESFQWKNNSGNIGGEIINSYVVHESNTFSVVATKGSCSLESNAIITTRKPQPAPPSSVTGPATLPAGDKLGYMITGSPSDDIYIWNTPAGTNIVYGDPRRASATIGFNLLGERVISVAAQKDGCDSEPVEKTLQVVEAVSSIPSQIPAELKVSPDNQVALPLISHSLRLDSFNQDDIKPVFEECQQGQYWVGFQLYYDALADLNTVPQWTALVDVTLMKGPDSIKWTRSLEVDMINQTFISTIFHDKPITCTDDYRFKIKTKSTYINGVQAPEQNIYLKVLLYKRMVDAFDSLSVLSLNASLNNGNIEASWSYAGNAVKGYDLEWVMIEDHDMFTPSTSHPAIEAFKFKEPVRVTVGPADFFYKHHAFYPSGKMWFRARAVGYNPQYPGHVIPGKWFYGSDTPLVITNPEASKNWQLQTVFAEEGKYKKVMSYFDGTLRQRQSQTNLSTDDLTLVGETLYDFEGRKAVDILPVPTEDVSLHYQPGFNVFAGSDPTVLAKTSAIQKKFHYDNRDLVNSVLSQTAGAGKYYSEMNTIGSPSMGPKDYVPDADGYVYSQAEFLNDGTGRVSRQSGVGEMFRMEGGHNTRNYYTEAARVELTRLFGPNVGNASHYKKNVTVDPNGQVSVSYVDQTGKVIATALAGDPPANVDALPSYTALTPNSLMFDLKSKNVITDDGKSKTIHKFLNEAVNTSYTFNYSLSAAGTTVPGFNCQACTYDMMITITNPDGKLLDLGAVAGNESGTTTRYQRNNLTAGCGPSTMLSSVQFTIVLADMGDYTITKTLTAHELTFDQISSFVQQDPEVQQTIQAIASSYVVHPEDCAICTATCPEISGAIGDAITEIADLDCANIMQNIIQDLTETFGNGDPNYVPADLDIQNHALYCKYQLCMKDKASDIFEKQLVVVTTWGGALAAGYVSVDANNPSLGPKLSNTSNSQDPFFNNEELSGYAKRGDMQAKINSITIASNGGVTFAGPLDQITNPDNKDFYVNGSGQHDPSGFHILYYSLMSQHAAGLAETDFTTQLDQQRWTLFRNFYIEQKRKIKLAIADYSNCVAARKDLEMQSDMSDQVDANGDATGQSQTSSNVTTWGQNDNGVGHGIDVNVSDPELETWIASLGLNCKSTFTASEVISMTASLRNYFDKSNVSNFLREILVSDVGVDPDLIAIQNILNNYGCSLGSVADESYLTCKSYATYSGYGPNLITNPTFSGCPVNANITAACSGWKPAYGTPFLMSDMGFQLDGTNCSQDALMGTLTTPLIPGNQYVLRFQYKSSTIQGASNSYVQFSKSQTFRSLHGGVFRVAQNVIQPLIAIPCDSIPRVIYPDYVTIDGETQANVWNYYGGPTDYIQVAITFTASQASSYIYFVESTISPISTTINETFKNVELMPIITVTQPPTCKEYNSLTHWAYTPNWQAAIDLCNQHAAEERTELIQFATNKYIEQQASAYGNTYRTNCINAAVEQLNYNYTPKEYHYTLYYYDQANNLVQTVPPAGVHPLDVDVNGNTSGYPPHDLLTNYRYTSINQLTWQATPDAGISEFVYDKKGQLRISHNAQQTIDGKYSYTKYDEQGRVTEVGELTAADGLTTVAQYIDDSRFPTTGVPELPTYATADVTHTYYDNPNDAITSKLLQQNLRARVSWVEVANQNDPDKTVTYYSYDIHGNVKSLVQQIPGLETKRTDYVYDLISGKVNYVFYQYGQTEQFIHKYTYDADNRIRTASTSSDAYLWYQDASYKYYAHGPLARTEVGEYRVQGQDYYYTLQGWIKGVNMPYAGDPGGDGVGSSKVGKDTYAYTLGYYQNDYKPSNTSLVLSDTRDQQWTQFGSMMGNSTGLYNGNISWMTTDLAKIGEINNDRTKGMQTMLYRYDQLHRIKKSQSLTTYAAGSGFAARTTTPGAYDEQYSYDANGNIMTLQRYNSQASLLDDFTYQYYNHKNRLASVRPITTTLNYTSAITTSPDKAYNTIILKKGSYVPAGSTVQLNATEAIVTEENIGEDGFYTEDGADFMAHIIGDDNDGVFVYDAIGNLIQDRDDGVVITWTPNGKIRQVITNDGAEIVSYLYDAAGNRVCKTLVNNGMTNVTHYARDANGDVMSVYNNLVVHEQPIYGRSRIGEFNSAVAEGSLTLGKRSFEFGNHLGNILAVTKDNLNFHGADVFAKVINIFDYYPFGLEMDARTYVDAEVYNYGFQGQEKDGDGEFSEDHYAFKYRMYNPEIGRFLSRDPLSKKYPYFSPYAFSGNRVIDKVELEGLEPSNVPVKGDCEGCKAEKLDDGDFFSDVQSQNYTATFSKVTPRQFNTFKKQMAEDPGKIVNNILAKYRLVDRDGSYGVTEGDHFDIDIFGPDNGYVEVAKVNSTDISLSVTVNTLRGHTDAGTNTFSVVYDPNKQELTWSTQNVSRSNDFMTQGIGSGVLFSRTLQQQQWKNVISKVYEYLGKPKVVSATATVTEYDYSDWSNEIGDKEERSSFKEDLLYLFDKK